MLSALIAPITGLLDKVIPDADTKVKIAHELATMSERHTQQIVLQQIEGGCQGELVPGVLATVGGLCGGARHGGELFNQPHCRRIWCGDTAGRHERDDASFVGDAGDWWYAELRQG